MSKIAQRGEKFYTADAKGNIELWSAGEAMISGSFADYWTLDCTVKQADSGDIDNAITIWVVLASLLLAIAAYVFCESGELEIAIALGIVSLIGINIPTVGYSWWRKHRRTQNLTNSSGRKDSAI